MSEQLRVVFDCNIFLQALAAPGGPAARCVEMALCGQVALYLSPIVLDEIRKVTSYPKLVAKFRLRPNRVAALLENLPKVAVIVPLVPELWRYSRDPDDAHYVNLALAADARLIVSRDADLLDLMDSNKPEAAEFQKRFPALRILDPVGFLREVASQR
ncbi:MAG: putative toxin-antitoxin system toxin component, PIN family [Tepidisphaeraceae bacterium]